MSLTMSEILFYAGGLFLLFLTPGPVWFALTARSLSGGFQAAWPLALGVAIGDVLWALLAVLSVTWVAATYGDVLGVLKWVAAGIFLFMGAMIIHHAGDPVAQNNRLTRGGMWAGFIAGLIVIIGNPKAILFYMGVLPGFFDMSDLTLWDITIIAGLAALVPLIGNLMLGAFIGHVRDLLSSPEALRRTNLVAGGLLILVGLAIPFI